MSETKKKRYPIDRIKLQALLEKKELELQELNAEVDQLRSRVKQANFDAIAAIAEMYNITADDLSAILARIYGTPKNTTTDLSDIAQAVPATPEEELIPEEEERTDDEET